ncbi:MAG: hypothetical protein ACRDTH_02350 [Pseudonocardiaceae bacterium]
MNAVAGPFANAPNSLQRAAQVYQAFDTVGQVRGAVESVYGKDLSALTTDERNEATIILLGLDSCSEVSPTFGEAARGALDALGLPSANPNPNTLGPALCPGIDPFGDQSKYRFEPNCGAGSSGSSDSANALPAGFVGNWSGSVEQLNYDRSPYTAQITVTAGAVGEQVAVGEYPTLDCTVSWDLISVVGNEIVVRETVETGPECLDVDITLTLLSDGTMRYDFENGNGTAILTRS